MKLDEATELQFESYEQMWQAAGWVVFYKEKNDKVFLSIACHPITGRIVKTIIHPEDANFWQQATFMKLAEHRS